MRAFFVASDLGTAWTGNQSQQDRFSELLDQYGLKKGGRLRDNHSGGARTYIKQLKMLGLIFSDETGAFFPTQAGNDMLEASEIVQTLQYQLLKLQYPSSDTLSGRSAIDRKFNIRPFVFLLKLAADPELNGLSDSDICVPIIFGENDAAFGLCKQLIIRGRENGLSAVIPLGPALLGTSTKRATQQRLIENLRSDVANTFSNYLESTGLAQRRICGSESRIFPQPDVLHLIEEVNVAPLIDFYGQGHNQADLQFGTRRGAVKDGRRNFALTTLPVLESLSGFISNRFMAEVGLPATDIEIAQFVTLVAQELRVTPQDVYEALEPILVNKYFQTGQVLVELSKGGQKSAERFEKAVTKIFELDFGYEAQWTGRSTRLGIGGHMDIFVVETGRGRCGIIDTKSMKVYDLPHQDLAKAATTYIDAASELYGSRNLDLSFVGYVSHQIGSGAEVRARELYDRKGVPVFLMSAYGLNNMRSNSAFQSQPANVTDRLSREPVTIIT